MIPLKTTLRGVPLVALNPDARYCRVHKVVISSEAPPQIGDCRRVEHPARYSADGQILLCRAYTAWTRGSNPYVNWEVSLYCGLRGEDWGIQCEVIQEAFIPPTDPEVIALRAEVTALNKAWQHAHAEEIAEEDERTRVLSAAHAAVDEFGRSIPDPPRELECLECGAVYSRSGHVEPGGMSCDRCK